ncbi:MAG TPA: hypothetical protein VGQ83_09805 [Polyangia bacterium]|jgi:hypothetical protein
MGKQARTRRDRQGEPAPATQAPRPFWRRPLNLALAGIVALGAAGVATWQARRPGRGPAADAGGALPPVTAGPRVLAEAEPNDSPAQAQRLGATPVIVDGALGAGDRDHYLIAITEAAGHLVDAWVEGLDGARLRVLRPDGAEAAAVTAPARIGALGAGSGDLIVVLEPGVPAATGRYRLHVTVSPWVKGSDWEPNDDPAHAQPMATYPAAKGTLARHRASGWWSRPGDVDCFDVPLSVPPEGAMVRLELTPPPGVRGQLTVLDVGNQEAKIPPRALVELAGDGPGQPLVIPALGGRSWESLYHVCTRAAQGENYAQPWRLDVRVFTPSGAFEFEPNGTRETASALPLGVPVGGFLTAGDVDWFRISAGAKGPVRVHVTPPADVAAEVVLLGQSGQELAPATGAPGQRVSATAPGAVFARVRALRGGSTTTQYEIIAVDAKILPPDGGPP